MRWCGDEAEGVCVVALIDCLRQVIGESWQLRAHFPKILPVCPEMKLTVFGPKTVEKMAILKAWRAIVPTHGFDFIGARPASGVEAFFNDLPHRHVEAAMFGTQALGKRQRPYFGLPVKKTVPITVS